MDTKSLTDVLTEIIFHTTFTILFSQKNSTETATDEESGKLLIGQQRVDEGEGRRGSVSFLEIHGQAGELRRLLYDVTCYMLQSSQSSKL